MAPGLVRIFRDIPGFGSPGSTAAGDAAVRVAPEDYIKASGEILFLTIVVSWIIAGIWNADTIERNALKDRIGYNNVPTHFDPESDHLPVRSTYPSPRRPRGCFLRVCRINRI